VPRTVRLASLSSTSTSAPRLDEAIIEDQSTRDALAPPRDVARQHSTFILDPPGTACAVMYAAAPASNLSCCSAMRAMLAWHHGDFFFLAIMPTRRAFSDVASGRRNKRSRIGSRCRRYVPVSVRAAVLRAVALAGVYPISIAVFQHARCDVVRPTFPARRRARRSMGSDRVCTLDSCADDSRSPPESYNLGLLVGLRGIWRSVPPLW